MIDDDLIKKQYNLVGNDPIIWKFYSESLSKASEQLYDQYSNIDINNISDNSSSSTIGELASLSKIVKMLRAMAIECLFKALWLKLGKNLVINGEFKKIPNTNNHDLCSIEKIISKIIDLKISDNENDLLKELSFYNSHGRYPIPKKWTIRKNHLDYGLGNKYSISHGLKSDNKLYNDFVKRLTEIFEKTK
ncbi:hypothetical protein ACFL6H_10275 [Candidatus Latescibacterota bacterium]